MKGKAPVDAKVAAVDSYPGLDAVLRKARKMEKLPTETEQRHVALGSMLPLNTYPAARVEFHQRLDQEYVKAVSNWRADNWLLPVEKEAEFPYARTRNIVDPLFKYGAAWLPRKDWDCGASLDSEGESIGFSKYTENIARAGILEAGDLRIKGISTAPLDEADPVLLKMKSENAALRERFDRFRFNRHEEMWNTYRLQGYTVLPRFQAFKLFSRQQQRLLEAYEATPNFETKKALLDHANQHGDLVRDLPEPDAPKPKPKPEPKKLSRKAAKKNRDTDIKL
jgi:hypothetical protein